MSSDLFQSREWLKYAQRVIDDVVPKLRQSKVSISIAPSGPTDIKYAVELGLSIMLDKPIILVVEPGARIPAKLAQVADAIVDANLDSPAGRRQLTDAINRVAPDMRRRP